MVFVFTVSNTNLFPRAVGRQFVFFVIVVGPHRVHVVQTIVQIVLVQHQHVVVDRVIVVAVRADVVVGVRMMRRRVRRHQMSSADLARAVHVVLMVVGRRVYGRRRYFFVVLVTADELNGTRSFLFLF